MKRLMITVVTVAMLAASSGAASAEPPADPPPSCVALITSYEASQLAPGFVGHEVSGLATSRPGLGSALVSPLAHKHLGSFESCREAEEG
jgi:hypothetical protein